MEDFRIKVKPELDLNWFHFTEIVRRSNTEFSRAKNTSDYIISTRNHHRFIITQSFIMEDDIENLIVFNPLLSIFLIEERNNEILDLFYENHKKGLKHFEKKYFVKYPSKRQVKSLIKRYNTEFKFYMTSGHSIYTNEVIKDLGFKNGLLKAYAEYEKDFINEFKKYSSKTNEPTKITPPPTKSKITGNHYALTYIMDCHANGIKPITGNKIELSNHFEERFKSNGVSIYSRYKEIFRLDTNIEKNLIAIGNEHWREIILELSENPTKLEQYLKGKNL